MRTIFVALTQLAILTHGSRIKPIIEQLQTNSNRESRNIAQPVAPRVARPISASLTQVNQSLNQKASFQSAWNPSLAVRWRAIARPPARMLPSLDGYPRGRRISMVDGLSPQPDQSGAEESDEVELLDPDTSFVSVSRWPPIKLYSFGEGAAFGSEVANSSLKLRGSRVVLRGDPVPNYLGGAFGGYQHLDLVPEILLDPPKVIPKFSGQPQPQPDDTQQERDGDVLQQEEDELEDKNTDLALDQGDPRLNLDQQSNATALALVPLKRRFSFIARDISWARTNNLDPQLQAALARQEEAEKFQESLSRLQNGEGSSSANEQAKSAVRRNFNQLLQRRLAVLRKLNAYLESARENTNTTASGKVLVGKVLEYRAALLQKLVSYFDRRVPPPVRRSMSGVRKVFTQSDARLHEMDSYIAALKDELASLRKPLRQIRPGLRAKISTTLQAYRMAILTKRMSYVDMNMSNIDAAVAIVNAEVHPFAPRRNLFRGKLDHVMSLQFYTPTSFISRILNPVGRLLNRRAKPLSGGYIVHNVHLLRDKRQNGYLTFQGSTNLGTWVDVNARFGKYDVDKEETPFAPAVDDQRWEAIQPGYLRDCHKGFCGTIQAFVSNEYFPELAKEVVGMKSISMVGHSMGGILASMFAMNVHAVKDLKEVTRLLARLRGTPILRILWPEKPPQTKATCVEDSSGLA